MIALIDYRRPLDEAVGAPRLHHQWMPDQALVEASFEPDLEAELHALGHAFVRIDTIGHANCIEVDPATPGFRAVADVTRDGGEAVAF